MPRLLQQLRELGLAGLAVALLRARRLRRDDDDSLLSLLAPLVLLALIGCEMFFDVPEYFQLAWRGVFVFVSLSFAVTQMDL